MNFHVTALKNSSSKTQNFVAEKQKCGYSWTLDTETSAWRDLFLKKKYPNCLFNRVVWCSQDFTIIIFSGMFLFLLHKNLFDLPVQELSRRNVWWHPKICHTTVYCSLLIPMTMFSRIILVLCWNKSRAIYMYTSFILLTAWLNTGIRTPMWGKTTSHWQISVQVRVCLQKLSIYMNTPETSWNFAGKILLTKTSWAVVAIVAWVSARRGMASVLVE